MTFDELEAILSDIDYPAYTIFAHEGERWYIQATYLEPDIDTDEPVIQYTRKWYISHECVKSEVTQTVLKLLLTSAEHRVREHFSYRGRRVYGPHLDVDILWELVGSKQALDTRDNH